MDTETTEKNNWGGARKGAGRKTVGAGERKRTSFFVNEEEKQAIKDLLIKMRNKA